MRLCAARFCHFLVPEDAPQSALYCSLHWRRLPQENKENLMQCYGTKHWEGAKDTASRRLWLIDSARKKRKRV